MARSLNKAQLIGNLTRDPELRYTANGTAVCSFGLATNRSWKTDTGEKREEADFHNIVAWNKLAEICSQFLVKGRKIYVEGRLSTRKWTGQDGTQRSTTEVVISDMIILDPKRLDQEKVSEEPNSVSAKEPQSKADQPLAEKSESKESASDKKAENKNVDTKQSKTIPKETAKEEDVSSDDIPF